MMFDLQLSFYQPLCYNSRAHYPLLQSLGTISAILTGEHSYFAVSTFKCGGKNSCHDLLSNPHIYQCVVLIINCKLIMKKSREVMILSSESSEKTSKMIIAQKII